MLLSYSGVPYKMYLLCTVWLHWGVVWGRLNSCFRDQILVRTSICISSFVIVHDSLLYRSLEIFTISYNFIIYPDSIVFIVSAFVSVFMAIVDCLIFFILFSIFIKLLSFLSSQSPRYLYERHFIICFSPSSHFYFASLW